MANATPAPAAAGSASARADVDPALLAQIKSASAPGPAHDLPRPPDAIPGPLGFFSGIVNVVQSLRIGMAASDAFREKYGDIHRFQFLGIPTVAVWDPDEVHKIFKNEDGAWSTAMGWDTM